MLEKKLTIVNKTGMHARPASQFVTLLNSFKSNIQIVKGTRTANAKSIINILSLGLTQGTEIIIKVDGVDEEVAIKSIENFITTLKE